MAHWLKRFHLTMMIVWAALAIPGILWWRESILFVIILSIYANFAGEFAAYQAARAEENDEDGDEDSARLERKVDELHAKVARLHRRWGGAPDDR